MAKDSTIFRALVALLWAGTALLTAATPVNALAADSESSGKHEYVMGIFPHLPPRDLENVFAPMASDLGSHIGRHVTLRSNTTFERFTENLDKQKFDIAFVQPFDYVRVADKYGYRPLATRVEKLAAIVVVKPDSILTNLASLKAKRIALPPESSAVSHLFLGQLRANGMDPDRDVKLSRHRSHVSCMQQVIIGEADDCVTAAPALRFFKEQMHVDLKIIAQSREIPHTLFIVHPRVPKKDRDALRARILSWDKTEEGKQMLARGQLTPFISIRDSDYNVVRHLSE